MPMHRVIGICLACLLTSACVAIPAPETSTTEYPSAFPSNTPENGRLPTDKSHNFPNRTVQVLERDNCFRPGLSQSINGRVRPTGGL
jgi:hypothetical protein